MLEIKRIVNDVIDENTYIVIKDNSCLVIDPGSNFINICKEIDNLKLLNILVTHNHFDHTLSVNDLKDKYKVEVLDFNTLDEKEYNIGPFTFKVIYNPGHSSDSISFYFEKNKIMFTGDFIFKESIGRCDLPTGNFSVMIKSIERLKKYDKDIVIYPGHGEDTTLEYELNNNPYMK